MSEQTIVRVTREHIARGKVKDCEKCPVALALIDALGDDFTEDSCVGVDPLSIEVYRPGDEGWEKWTASTPPSAGDFICAFDDLDNVGPIEFTLTWRITHDPEPLP